MSLPVEKVKAVHCAQVYIQQRILTDIGLARCGHRYFQVYIGTATGTTQAYDVRILTDTGLAGHTGRCRYG
jgi:hypothetical protein